MNNDVVKLQYASIEGKYLTWEYCAGAMPAGH
jgi:hypothetical protein